MVYNTKHMIQVIQINRTNNKGNKKNKKGGGEKRRKHNEWKQDTNHNFLFRLTFKESFRHGDG